MFLTVTVVKNKDGKITEEKIKGVQLIQPHDGKVGIGLWTGKETRYKEISLDINTEIYIDKISMEV